MLVIGTAGKGGSGRSVSLANIAYRRALQGDDVCYADFDFGSPAGAEVFELPNGSGKSTRTGLHSYLQGRAPEPERIPVWTRSDRAGMRFPPAGSGRLVFVAGDEGGGEFAVDKHVVQTCAELVLHLAEEFDVCFLDCSAGRSYALDLLLEVTARAEFRSLATRWLVFHRWTRQHITAAAGLVHGPRGILATGAARGHDAARLRESIRYVRVAVADPQAPVRAGWQPNRTQFADHCDHELREFAGRSQLGPAEVFGSTPIEPLLQLREQIVTDDDVWTAQVANRETIVVFDALARRITDAWEVE